jgi:hypothetical protein
VNAIKNVYFRKVKSASGFKASKECFSMLATGNANGDKKLRPMLTY